MDEMQPGLPGMEIDTTIFRPATFIELSIDNLTKALLIGALLVVLVLGAFLFEWRAALISVVAIPLSLVAAALVLYARGATINVMVLAGFVIALGVVVDDAIIDVQNIVRRLRENRREGSRKSAFAVVLEASLEVRGPIVYATLIIVAAMVPVFFLTGLTGAFFQPLAFSYVLAVVASLVVALTVTPALCLILLPKCAARAPRVAARAVARARLRARSCTRIVHQAAPGRTSPLPLTVAAGLAVTPFLGQSLLPSFKERDFLMHWLTSPDTSGPEETRVSIRACRELRAIPGVRNCGSHIGQALLTDEVVGVYFGENWISVDPEADYDETLARVQERRRRLPGDPARRADLPEGADQRGADGIERRRSSCASSATTWTSSAAKAEEVLKAIEGVDGLVEAKVELHADVPQVQVKVDLAEAQRYGIKPGDVRRAAATLDRERGGRRHLQRRQGLRRPRLEHARDAQQPDQHRGASDRHASRDGRFP